MSAALSHMPPPPPQPLHSHSHLGPALIPTSNPSPRGVKTVHGAGQAMQRLEFGPAGLAPRSPEGGGSGAGKRAGPRR